VIAMYEKDITENKIHLSLFVNQKYKSAKKAQKK
jgi:hypothetical protein